MALACAVILAAAAGCSSPERTPPPGPVGSLTPAPAARNTPLADLPPLPPGVNDAVRSPEVVRAVYEFAARHPEVLHFVPCFCGCERGGHRDNDDCFVARRDRQGRVTQWETHALGCEICIDVARQAMQMHNAGASVAAIRDAVEKMYAGIGDGHTPTPMPSHAHGGLPQP